MLLFQSTTYKAGESEALLLHRTIMPIRDGAITLHDMLKIPDEMAEYVNDYKMILVEAREHQVNKTVLMAVAGTANVQLDYNTLEKKKGGNGMITVFEETRREGKIEGKAEGIIETGIDCGLSENDILKRLQEKLNVSLQVAQKYFEMFGKRTV